MAASIAHSNDDPFVRARVEPSLKLQAMKILKAKSITVSDLLREVLVRVVSDGDLPFPVRTRTGVVSPETKAVLDKMFLPELHQTRWAERLAQLQDEQDAATDPAQVQAIEEQIREHYKHEYDVSQTERALRSADTAHKSRSPRAR